jgi:formamidopyrimidine-DNA glycosylase
MPELPEVEIASRHLRSWLTGRRIVKARAERSRVIRGQTPRRFAELGGRSLARIDRVGKWMLLSFDGGEALLSHLGMTGKWIRRDRSEKPPPHVRATLELDDGHAVDYRDPRLFGRLVRIKLEQLRDSPPLRALGPDPLGGIDVDRLHTFLSRTKRSLKEALMDQRTLAGLGNIYVSESLHRAGLAPQRAGVSLSRDETERLAGAIPARRPRRRGQPRTDHLRRRGWREPLPRVRPRRPALRHLRNSHPAHGAGRPQHLLLPDLPAFPEGPRWRKASAPPNGERPDRPKARLLPRSPAREKIIMFFR